MEIRGPVRNDISVLKEAAGTKVMVEGQEAALEVKSIGFADMESVGLNEAKEDCHACDLSD